MSFRVVTAACLALFIVAGGPALAQEGKAPAKHKAPSCSQEATHKGIKSKKERSEFIKRCEAERKKAREHAKEMKKQQEMKKEQEMKQEQK